MHAPKLALASNHERQSSVIEDQGSVTSAVLSAMADTESPRLRENMEAYVRHMHDFAREVRLTEEEFELGVEFLNPIGQATNDRHNEGILFSDAIGFSTLVCLLDSGKNGTTETAVMTKALARALAPKVRVLAVSPGAVDTPFVPGRGPEFNDKIAATTPLKRVAIADDVAAAVVACATHLGFSTGSTIVVDGGRAL